ncbi:hypothetical protein [Plantibacter sp. CFBP 13570]|uniref:hypothetical protein n=1 Tax=Plantibacter sp. CFBP 13570 TaxID=2775272 RepID=UPI001FD16A2F|nr:hypothetical protein [Plantibacter sp. CFBP 13570]
MHLAAVPVEQLRPAIVARCTATAAELNRPVLLEITDTPSAAYAVWPDGVLSPVQGGATSRHSAEPSTLTGPCRACGTAVPVQAASCPRCGCTDPWAAFTTAEPHITAETIQDAPDTVSGPTVVRASAPVLVAGPALGGRALFTRRRVLIGGGAALLALLGAGGAAIAFTASGRPSAPRPSSTAKTVAPVVTVPGWARVPLQEFGRFTAVGDVAFIPETATIGFATGAEAVLVDAASGTVHTRQSCAAAGMYAALIDGSWAVIAVTGQSVHLWAGSSLEHAEMPLPAGGKLRIRGGLPFVTDGTSSWRVAATGLVPIVSPRPGTALIGQSASGLLWASARGSVITADDAGTALQELPLAPVPGLSLSTWLGVLPGVVLTAWVDGLGSQNVVAHHSETGEVIGTAAAGAVTAESVVTAPGSSTAVIGSALVDADAATVTGIPAGFTASTALDGVFLGTHEQRPALLTGTTVEAIPAPAATVLGCTGTGLLVTSTGGHLQVFAPETSTSN